MTTLTFTQLFKACIVEVIHNLWHAKLYRGNGLLRMLQEEWHPEWVLWKTMMTMKDVDRQAEALTPDPEIVPPIYWEEEEGETPLGGPMGFYYDFVDDSPGSPDPLQGAEQRQEDGE